MNADVVVRASGLTKSYGDVRALDGVDLEAQRGEIFGLLGPNGAGKTTTVKILTTLEHGFGGQATLFGLDVARDPDAVRSRIGYVPQELTADRYLTARESLVFFCSLYHVPKPEQPARIAHLIELLDLGDAADRLLRTFSGGMKKKLDLACGLVHQPELLFLDEPSLGLDVDVRRALWDHVESLAASGTTVMLCTNYMDEAERLCDRLAILDSGKVSVVGTPRELREGLGGDVVSVELVQASDAEKADASLSSLGFVRGTWREEVASPSGVVARVDATVENNEQALPQMLAALTAAGVAVRGASYHRPGLEEVFLRHTGHRFADAHGQSGPPPRRRK